MGITGDLKNANKFCVDTPDKGIQWVPSLEVAKQYVNNPNLKDWYGKDIIATYEQVVQAYDGKFYFRSQEPKKPIEQEAFDSLVVFKEQAQKKIKTELQSYAKSKGFESFLELISFTTSTVKKYKAMAKEAVSYRDKLYSYTEKFFDDIEIKNLKTVKDISNVYDEYLINFPFM